MIGDGEGYLEEDVKVNKGLVKVYFTLFFMSIITVVLSIISSEHKPHFEMRMKHPDSESACPGFFDRNIKKCIGTKDVSTDLDGHPLHTDHSDPLH